jgi:hypothetical protein
MSPFTLKVDEETTEAMSERQLRVFHAVNYMLDTLETYGVDVGRSHVVVYEDWGRLAIELRHLFDDRFSFAVTMQETSRVLGVWFDSQSVTFRPDDYDSPDGWIDEGLHLVWDTLRGLIDLEITRRKGEKVRQRIYRHNPKDGSEEVVFTWWLADFRRRWGLFRDARRFKGRVERFRMQYQSASDDDSFR